MHTDSPYIDDSVSRQRVVSAWALLATYPEGRDVAASLAESSEEAPDD